MNRLFAFLDAATPTWTQLFVGIPAGLAVAAAFLSLAGWLKQERRWRTGYSRKTFHFLTFFTVALLHARWGTAAVCIYGATTSLVVFYAIWRGNGHPWYEAMAREKDAPLRTYFILAPYAATLLGGIACNVFFGKFAITGYLVAGIGDAIGEPVGTRWGRHVYRVPSFGGVVSHRSIEGSLAVFCVSVLALSLGLVVLHHPVVPQLAALLSCAAICALAEAVSPHGWDNAVLQLVPAGLAMWWVG